MRLCFERLKKLLRVTEKAVRMTEASIAEQDKRVILAAELSIRLLSYNPGASFQEVLQESLAAVQVLPLDRLSGLSYTGRTTYNLEIYPMTEVRAEIDHDSEWLTDYAEDGNENDVDEGVPVPESVRMHLEHEDLTTRIATLSQELAERRSEAMKELVASIVGWVDNYGLGRFEVMAELRKIIGEPKAKAKGKAKPKPAPMKVTLFADADCPGQIYKRPFPVDAGADGEPGPEPRRHQAAPARDAHLKAVG